MSDMDLDDFDPHHYGGSNYSNHQPSASSHHGHSSGHHADGSPYASGALPSRSGFDEHPDLYLLPGAYAAGLGPPRQKYRPRSQPPPMTRSRDRSRDRSRSRSRDRDRDRPRRRNDDDYDPEDPHKNSHSPVGKVQHALHHTFSQSTSGLGVGVLGAIVGGLSAREASLAASRRIGHTNGGNESNKAALLSTIVGAAVGGLGANALEKRIESNRKKDQNEQVAWEKKWGKDGVREREVIRDRDRDGRGSRELVRTREVARDRSRDRGRRDSYTYSDDDERNYVYDDRRGYRPRSVHR